MDGDAISRMGNIATGFAESFEDVLSEIWSRTYADQEQIYGGFLKLNNQQRTLVLARRDLATRLKDSVAVAVVDKPQLDAPPELPGHINKSKTLTQRKTTGKRKRTARRKVQ